MEIRNEYYFCYKKKDKLSPKSKKKMRDNMFAGQYKNLYGHAMPKQADMGRNIMYRTLDDAAKFKKEI